MLHVEEIRPFRVPESPHNRLVTIAIVAGLHIAVIVAFMLSLRPQIFAPVKDPICLTCLTDTHPKNPSTKPPPDVVLKNPKLPDTAPPKIVQTDETPSKDTITVTVAPPIGPVGPTVHDFGPRAIAGTHTIPDYPPLDRRLGHEGSVMLRLAIDERGQVVDSVVERSSGYGGLDQAAADWVKAHWRYYPATHSGDAVTSTAEVTVTVHLTAHN